MWEQCLSSVCRLFVAAWTVARRCIVQGSNSLGCKLGSMTLCLPNGIHIGSTVFEISRVQLIKAGVDCGQTAYSTAFKLNILLAYSEYTSHTKRHPYRLNRFRDIPSPSYKIRRALWADCLFYSVQIWKTACVGRLYFAYGTASV